MSPSTPPISYVAEDDCVSGRRSVELDIPVVICASLSRH